MADSVSIIITWFIVGITLLAILIYLGIVIYWYITKKGLFKPYYVPQTQSTTSQPASPDFVLPTPPGPADQYFLPQGVPLALTQEQITNNINIGTYNTNKFNST